MYGPFFVFRGIGSGKPVRVCGVGGFPEFTWCNGMKSVGTMVRTYMIQSKLEPLRAVAALPEDWVAGEDDWYP